MWAERQQIKHPARLSPKDKQKLRGTFMRAMERAKRSGEEDKLVMAYLKFHTCEHELAQAVAGKHGRRLNAAFYTWSKAGLITESRME